MFSVSKKRKAEERKKQRCEVGDRTREREREQERGGETEREREQERGGDRKRERTRKGEERQRLALEQMWGQFICK